MFIVLSKVLDLVATPLAWAIVFASIAALAVRRRPRLARCAAASAALVLLVFSAPLVSHYVVRSVERRAARTYQPGVTYDAVIVLAGIVDPDSTRATGELQLSDRTERILTGWDVLRSGRASHILVSGGNVFPQPGEVPEAELLGRLLLSWGVRPDQLVLETASRNTHQSAVETAKLVRQRGFRRLLLITSAAHMPRAVGCFRREGLSPDTLPVDYNGGDPDDFAFLPRASALSDCTDALRELLGRLVYRVMGYT